MAFNFKTATPVTSGLTDSFLYFGAESQAEADPDIYTLLALKNYVLAGVSSDITIGSTAIVGGTTTRILYDNAGVVGEYTLTGTGTVVAMANGPTFTAPLLGTPASGVLTNCTGLVSFVVANEASDTTCFPLFATAATGELGPKSNANLTFDSSGGILGATRVRAGSGSVTAPAFSFTGETNTGIYNTGTSLDIAVAGARQVAIQESAALFLLNDAARLSFGGGIDLVIRRDAANTLAQRNGTNAQAFRVYNTESSSLTNYERGIFDWITLANNLLIGTQAAGTGTARNVTITSANTDINFAVQGVAANYRLSNAAFLFLQDNTYDIGASGATRPRTGYFGTSIVSPIATLTQGTITADAPQINGTVTWNNAGVTFTAWKLNVTDSASGVSSLMYDFQKGGTSLQKMDAFGNVTFSAGSITTGTATTAWRIAYDGLTGGSTAPLAWTSGQPTGTKDLFLYRDAANTLALRNSTNAQTFRVYATESSSLTNYERLALQTGSGYVEVAAETAGTGTDNLDVRITPAGTGSLVVPSIFSAGGGSGAPAVNFRDNGGGIALQFYGGSPKQLSLGTDTTIGFNPNASVSGANDAALIRDGAAGIIAQRADTQAQTYRWYGNYVSSTDYHRGGLSVAKTTLSNVSGASVTATSLIPDGALVVGVTTKVTVAISGGGGTTGYQVGDGSDTDRWGVAATITAGTTTDNTNATATTVQLFTSANNVVITADGGNFNGTGDIMVCVFYLIAQAD